MLARMVYLPCNIFQVTYQRLISANCLKGDLNGASKILEKMKEENLPINEHIFNALITGHACIG